MSERQEVYDVTSELATRTDGTAPELAIEPISDTQGALARLRLLQDFVKQVLVKGEDYGEIPGVAKPCLFKPGAEKLTEMYGLAASYDTTRRIEEWERGFWHYEIVCTLTSRRSGHAVGQGLGSCNSMEDRYRWREAKRHCPECGLPAIIKGKFEYGGGWLCFKKLGGCGFKFDDDHPAITSQPIGRVENESRWDLPNTLLKMAKKRALVDAALSVTRSSAIFTQDVEDLPLVTAPPSPAEPVERKRQAANAAKQREIQASQRDPGEAELEAALASDRQRHGGVPVPPHRRDQDPPPTIDPETGEINEGPEEINYDDTRIDYGTGQGPQARAEPYGGRRGARQRAPDALVERAVRLTGGEAEAIAEELAEAESEQVEPSPEQISVYEFHRGALERATTDKRRNEALQAAKLDLPKLRDALDLYEDLKQRCLAVHAQLGVK